MSAPYDPKALKSVMEAASPPDLDLRFRAMFGGILSYANGQPFASLSNVGLALKMSGDDHTALSALPGVKPLRYEPDQPQSKSYLVLPDDMLSDHVALRSWIARSAAGLQLAHLKPAVKKSRQTSKGQP
jgi:TfoX/Sxy family transcriptional regulator of competence genes